MRFYAFRIVIVMVRLLNDGDRRNEKKVLEK
jgi:hypothetical protein